MMADIPDIVTAVVESLPQSGAVTLASAQMDQCTTGKATTCTSRITEKSSQSFRRQAPGSSSQNHEVLLSSEPEESSDKDADNEEFVLTEQHIIGVHTDHLRYNYSVWIPAWKSHLEGLPVDVKVPPAAMAISSPLVANNWKKLLSDHWSTCCHGC